MSTLYSSLSRAVCFAVLLNVSCSHALEPSSSLSSKEDYFAYLRRYPETLGPVGNALSGEIEIIEDLQTITEIEQSTGRQVGVIASLAPFVATYSPLGLIRREQ